MSCRVSAVETGPIVSGDEAFSVTGVDTGQNAMRSTTRLRCNVQNLVNVTAHLLVQACMPSAHVYSKSVSPTSPHLLNQEPPRAQQLSLPDFLAVPHLGHAELTATGAGVAGGGVVVPGRTDFEHRATMWRCNRYGQCIANISPTCNSQECNSLGKRQPFHLHCRTRRRNCRQGRSCGQRLE